MAYQDFDFIGFTYNGKHSYRDLGIYRVSGGDRYEETFTPTFQEKTAQIDGMIGSYYFGQNIQNRQFNINFAFDRLTEEGIRKLKQTFNGDGIHDLIFDEHPYKVYSAKVTGSATLKTICFELEEGRIYRGEGTITFTCYYPYAHTPHSFLDNNENKTPEKIGTRITYKANTTQAGNVYTLLDTPPVLKFLCGIMIEGGEWYFTVPRSNQLLAQQIVINYYQGGKKKTKTSSLVGVNGDYAFNFGNGNVYVDTIEYALYARLEARPGSLESTYNFEMYNNSIRYINSKVSGNDQCYRRADTSKTMQKPNPKIANDYSAFYYPTKREWVEASGLPLHTMPTKNTGDLPATFKVEYKSGNTVSDIISVSVGSSEGTDSIKTISFKPSTSTEYVWNSKTGMVCKDNKPVATTGDICTEIPVNGSVAVNTTDSTKQKLLIDYDFWYY